MTPNVSDTGHSFKGAFAYYLNDKRADPAQPHPTTAERVAWTETRNLATDSPHMAWRIMRATAAQADELKRAAGVRNTGRKATGGPVFAYSLSWRGPDEAKGLTREGMHRAALDSLKVLKADHLQAVIVAHRDTANPHVHVVVNRIDPATGKTHTFGQSQTKLSDWAARYERDRGMIVTPNRQEAAKAREDARRRPAGGQEAAPAWAKRKQAQKQPPKPEQAAKPPRIDGERPKPLPRRETPASRLKALGDAQKARHAAEREKLWTDQQARRQAILAAAGQEIRDRAAAAKAANRPHWADHFRRQKSERWLFEQRERHLAGKVRNAIEAVTSRQIRGDGSDRGFLSMAFAYLASRDARRTAFEARQKQEGAQLSATLKARQDRDAGRIKEARERQLAEARAAFTRDKAALSERQGREVQDVRAQWRALYAERERRAAWSNESTRRAATVARQEPEAVKDSHDRARDPRPPAPPVPNRMESLSRPAPAPSPSGDVPPANRAPAPVPAIDKAKAWADRHHAPAQPSQLRREWASRAEETPAPRRDYASRGDEPEAQPPARPYTSRDVSAEAESRPARDWASRDSSGERYEAPTPDRWDDQEHDIN